MILKMVWVFVNFSDITGYAEVVCSEIISLQYNRKAKTAFIAKHIEKHFHYSGLRLIESLQTRTLDSIK